MAPASAGNNRRSKIIVNMIAHTNNGVCSGCILRGRIFIIEVDSSYSPITETESAAALQCCSGGHAVH